jgi:hypothetical protein
MKLLFLYVSMIVSCYTYAGAGDDAHIKVKPCFRDKAITLSTSNYITRKGDTLTFDRLKMYLSSFSFTLDNGDKIDPANSYHLIDLEDPSSLQLAFNYTISHNITRVSFNIGIDSATSVAGALGGDLDPVKGMYWAWNSGYINMKLEGSTKTETGKMLHPFEFHIGGYMQPYYALRRITIDLGQPTQLKDLVMQVDLSKFCDELDLKKEHSIMIPGKEAMQIADMLPSMFRITTE